jgi:PAS domain S-box-containing protein
VVIGRDITTQKATAEALQRSETRYRNLAEQIPEGIFVADSQGRYVDANRAACELVGYTLAELQTRTVRDLLAPSEWERLPGQFANLLAGELVRNQWQFQRKDGSTFTGELLGRQLSDGRFQGIVRDVTADRKVEAALRQFEAVHRQDSETLHALLSTAAQGILEVDDGGVIRSVNAALESMLGWSSGELVGQPHGVLIPVDKQVAHEQQQRMFWAAPRARPMGRGVDLVARRKDGSTLPVEVSLAPVATARGRVVFAFVTDITTRRREEMAREAYARELELRSDQLRELATALTLAEQRAREALSRTLHDGLQQTLFGVKLKLEWAEQSVASGGARQREALARARQDLQDAISEARALAVELAPPMLNDGGLPAALTWLAGWVRQRHGLTVAVTAEPDANPASEEVRTLAFISVRELLFNVAKHAGVHRAVVTVASIPGDLLQITVADEGVGFDPAAVWSPGHLAPGLGLVGVRERMRLLGGRFDIDSAPGRGTRVTMLVPAGPTLALPSAPASHSHGEARDPQRSDPAAAGHSLRILLADDHALVRDGLRELLSRLPELQVVGEASDGASAIALAGALRPDVVIMDVAMPGLGGVDATRRLRAEQPEVEVLALSTHPRPNGEHPIEAAGATGYFCKGDDTQLLIDRLLSMQRARRASRPSPPPFETP